MPITEAVRQAGWSDSVCADLEARTPYFTAGVATTLYGSKTHPLRWHRWVERDSETVKLLGVELASDPFDPRRGFVLVHVEIDSAAIETLQRLTRPAMSSAWWLTIEGLLPDDWRLESTSRRAISVTSRTGFDLQNETATAQLWELAAATSAAAVPPSRQQLDAAGRIDLSADWSVLVLRDGIGFGIDRSAAQFGEYAVVLGASVYTDVIVLAQMQLSTTNELLSEISSRMLNDRSAIELIRLERRTFDFRRSVWWTDVSPHGNANSLLNAYQEGFQLEQRVEGLVADVADASRLAAGLLAERSSVAISLLSFVGVPLTAAYAGAALLPYHGWPIFGCSSAAALVGSIALFRSHWLSRRLGIVRGRRRPRSGVHSD